MLGRAMTGRTLQSASWVSLVAVAGIAVLLGVVAVLSPALAIGGAVAVAFVGLMVADVTVGVALFTFVAFLEVLPGLGGLSAAKVAGVVLALSWMAAATTTRTREQLASAHPWILYVGLVFLTWVAASMLWSEDASLPSGALLRYAPNLLLLPIVFAAVRTRRDLELIIGVFVGGALLSALYGAFIAPPDPTVDAERIGGAGVDPNYLALSLAAALSLAFGALANRSAAVPARMLAAGASIILLTALLLTASRTGLVALAGGSVCALAIAGRRRRVPVLLAVLAMFTAGAVWVLEIAPREVRDHITQTTGGGTGRTDIWTVGLRMAKANPLVGVGADNYRLSAVHYLLEPGEIRRADFIVDRPKVAHNIYLQVWAELGLVGLALFLVLVGFAITCGLRAIRLFDRMADAGMAVISRSVVVAISCALIGAFFVSIHYEKSLWLLLALGPCLLALARRSGAAR